MHGYVGNKINSTTTWVKTVYADSNVIPASSKHNSYSDQVPHVIIFKSILFSSMSYSAYELVDSLWLANSCLLSYVHLAPGRIQDSFKEGLGGNSYIIYKNYIIVYIAIIHIIILINRVHVSTYCAWSYSLHVAVPAATTHQCYYNYVCTIICSLTWPDPISCRGTIACSISAYAASDNAPMRTRVWPRETRSFMLFALPHGHFNPIASVLLSKSLVCLFDNSSRECICWQCITWIQVQITGYISYFKMR